MSTPKSSGVMVSMGFFFAFIMFGRVAYLGSFNRKSAVTMHGSLHETFCTPPSMLLAETNEAKLPVRLNELPVACK